MSITMFDLNDLKKAIDEAKEKKQKVCVFFYDSSSENLMTIWEEKNYPDCDVVFHCKDYVGKNNIIELSYDFFSLNLFNFPFAIVIDFRKKDVVTMGVLGIDKESVGEYPEDSENSIDEWVSLAKILLSSTAGDVKLLKEYKS